MGKSTLILGGIKSGKSVFAETLVKEKTGARMVDVRPQAFVDPRFREHEIWELTKEEWNRREPGD